ncbi:MAG: sigma-70 family RNA polymerase sigma factor [Deltaproteobacteria bacterium]|nr:sigma-70 family RNA polymerase sigma factor [Deltaproteobacteria bacterium]
MALVGGVLAAPLRLPGQRLASGLGAVAVRRAGVPGTGTKARPASAEDGERAFLARCLANAPGVQEEFLERYAALVRFAIGSVLRQRGVRLEPEDHEDLFQGVVLSFFDKGCRRLKMYDGRNQASFATFVRVCATRQTLDYLRRASRRAIVLVEEAGDDARAASEDLADPASGPEETTATSETFARLRGVVAGLPAREQMLVRLHFVNGQSIPEVARVLGISDNAAHVLKSRLRAKLRQQMGLESDD